MYSLFFFRNIVNQLINSLKILQLHLSSVILLKLIINCFFLLKIKISPSPLSKEPAGLSFHSYKKDAFRKPESSYIPYYLFCMWPGVISSTHKLLLLGTLINYQTVVGEHQTNCLWSISLSQWGLLFAVASVHEAQGAVTLSLHCLHYYTLKQRL